MAVETNLGTILDSLQPEDNLGVLLAAQMGGTPQEIQLIIQTTRLDEEKDALVATGQYIVRAINTIEHRITLGLFNNIAHSTSNPILYKHNEPLYEVFFRGKPENVDNLMLDIQQLYGQTYGIYRHMADELNRARPLASLLGEGYGYLGTMPAPFVERIKKLFNRYGMQINTAEAESHRPDFQFELLVMDDSFIVAQLFSVDPMKQKAGQSA